jgi:hypothetical protein
VNAALEIHDSTLKGVERRGSSLTLVFEPGYVHRSEQRPGIDAGTGWNETVHVIVAGGEAHGNLTSLPEELSGGSLQCGVTTHENSVPIPLQFTGPVSLQLTCSSGLSVVVVGHSVSAALVGTGSYVEAFPGAPLNSAPGAG